MNPPRRQRKSGPKASLDQASYLDLVQRFALRPIRSHAELDQAIAVIDELIDRSRLNAGEQDYLDVLGDLVEAYEDKHFPMPEVESDAEALHLLLEGREISQQQLARATGIANSTISAVLHGSRALNRNHIEILSEFFRVDPSLFVSLKARRHAAGA